MPCGKFVITDTTIASTSKFEGVLITLFSFSVQCVSRKSRGVSGPHDKVNTKTSIYKCYLFLINIFSQIMKSPEAFNQLNLTFFMNPGKSLADWKSFMHMIGKARQ